MAHFVIPEKGKWTKKGKAIRYCRNANSAYGVFSAITVPPAITVPAPMFPLLIIAVSVART